MNRQPPAPGRRQALKAIVASVPAAWLAPAHGQGEAAAPPAQRVLKFFNAREAETMDAIADRLIPPDAAGPGGRQAGVTDFLDGQLAGAWGAGDHMYRQGPFEAGTPQQGYQLSLTPAEMFRRGLRALDERVQAGENQPFAALSPAQQDAWLGRLQANEVDLGPLPAAVFFQALLDAAIEGFFSDPVYGGNKGMAGWKLVGFPGAYASFSGDIERHGQRWEGQPVSIADAPAGHGGGEPHV